MMRELTAEDPDRMRLYLARHEGDRLALPARSRLGPSGADGGDRLVEGAALPRLYVELSAGVPAPLCP